MRQPGFEPGLRACFNLEGSCLRPGWTTGASVTFINYQLKVLNMTTEEIIKKSIKKFKKKFPEMGETLEKELIPLKPGEELQPRVLKKKKKL